ncbi:MAG: hypothetical protein M0Z43_09700 [Acidithiobacillus sp.]|nr:hypothetical protein [Acidithiobacillus sp.]
MSQGDQNITTAEANTGATMRAAINAELQAIVSNSSGATAPLTTYPYQYWADVTSGYLKQRDAANATWISLYKLDGSAGGLFSPMAGPGPSQSFGVGALSAASATAPTPPATDYSTNLATTIFVKDALRAQLEGMTGGACTVLYDVAGNPNYMRIVPAFRCEDIHPTALGTGIHPAFYVNGVLKSQIFYGMYAAANVGGLGCSIPGMAPYVSINFDNAKLACTNKGVGWHLRTNWEWAAITLWTIKNGDPALCGNTYYGQSHAQPYETGGRADGLGPANASGNAYILNGSGPASWRHDKTFAGISDLVGNVWEWCDGLKLFDGQIIMPGDNNFTLAEGSWPNSGVFFDSTVAGNLDGIVDQLGAPKLAGSVTNYNNTPSTEVDLDYSYLSAWKSLTKATGYAVPNSIKQALLWPYDATGDGGNGTVPEGGIWMRNNGTRLPIRGGYWGVAADAGLAALNLVNQRSLALTSIGFRPAFIG